MRSVLTLLNVVQLVLTVGFPVSVQVFKVRLLIDELLVRE